MGGAGGAGGGGGGAARREVKPKAALVGEGRRARRRARRRTVATSPGRAAPARRPRGAGFIPLCCACSGSVEWVGQRVRDLVGCFIIAREFN